MTLREAKLVDDLFVQGGYVLNFTNQTFTEFFRHEVGVEIYDDVYGFRGNSKGKRLVAFTQKAQPKAIAKTLAGLWSSSFRCPREWCALAARGANAGTTREQSC